MKNDITSIIWHSWIVPSSAIILQRTFRWYAERSLEGLFSLLWITDGECFIEDLRVLLCLEECWPVDNGLDREFIICEPLLTGDFIFVEKVEQGVFLVGVFEECRGFLLAGNMLSCDGVDDCLGITSGEFKLDFLLFCGVDLSFDDSDSVVCDGL